MTVKIGDKVIYRGRETRIVERIGDSHMYRVVWEDNGTRHSKSIFSKYLIPLEDRSGWVHQHPAHAPQSVMSVEAQRDYYQDIAAELYDENKRLSARIADLEAMIEGHRKLSNRLFGEG
jgi:hypothetical protein